MKPFRTLLLSALILLLLSPVAQSATLGPASDYTQLLELAAQAADGDVILITGEIVADSLIPLNTQASITLDSGKGARATLHSLRLENAQITINNVSFVDSLTISGTSHIELGSGVSVRGAYGKSGLTFDGNGVLIMYPECTIEGGEGSEGVTIHHRGGDFYAGIEGTILGGSGRTGGSGLTISQLSDNGTLMISGSITGGSGNAHGGHALNLYELSDNAFITVTGTLTGGDGSVGGDGIQVVATSGNASVGIHGTVSGGQGHSYGGDALILMNMGGASSVNLSGALTGGDVTDSDAQPGTSLLVVGSGSASRTRVGDCILQDGVNLSTLNATPTPTPTEEPDITPLPEITSSVEDAEQLATPAPTPTPEPIPDVTAEPTQAPAQTPSAEPVPEPTHEPSATLEPESTITPLPEPTASPATP